MRALTLCCLLICWASAAHAQSSAALHLVFVLDGLRPDSINEADTPNLDRLRKEGVWFENTHAVFPTVTRVNATSLATGSYPARHGMMGNSIFIPAVDPKRAFTNDNAARLLKLDEVTSGAMVTAPGIAELLEKTGRRMIAVSSGGSGSSLLLSPKAHRGTGTVISGDFASLDRAAWPDAVSAAVLQRFGKPPKKGGAKDAHSASVDWSMEVLREYVLAELKPQVVFTWMTEPDHTQHAHGLASPEAVAVIRNDDRQLGLVLAKLEKLGLRDRTNIIVVSDHGFAQTVYNVNVGQALTAAGFMKPDTDDVVIATSGQAVALHVKGRDRARIGQIAQFLQNQQWCGLVFTAARQRGQPHEGTAPGTFSLEYVHLGGHERSPDVVFTFSWSSAQNPHGVRGADSTLVTGERETRSVEGPAASHGGIGPWTVRNTMLAWGPDFKHGAKVRTPSSNVDVTPTVLHLLGVRPGTMMDGRPLVEALASGPDPEKLALDIRTLHVANGAYRAALQVSEVEGRRYVDKGWREP